MPKGEYLQKVLPSPEYMQSGYSKALQSAPDMVQPYIDPNFSEPPKWTVEVEFKEWRDLPYLQKDMITKERLVNARTIEELNLAYSLKRSVHNLNKTNNDASYNSSNKSMH